MKSVWQEAASAMARVDCLVFFGYSLPTGDIEAEKLFQRTVAANGALGWIDLVNPAPAVAALYASVFPSKELRRFVGVDTFLARTRPA
jgi:hypothetical protein